MYPVVVIGLLLCIIQDTYSCEPQILVDGEKTEGAETAVICNIPTACTSTRVVWEKNYKENEEWKEVFEEQAGTYQPLDTDVGYNLQGRSNGFSGGGPFRNLRIDRSIPADSGGWRCKVFDGTDDYFSAVGELQVISDLTSDDIEIIRNKTTTIGEPQKYTCKSKIPVYPQFNVTWETEGNNYTKGANKTKPGGFIWNIENEIELTMLKEDENMPVYCYFIKTTGIPLQIKRESTATPFVPVVPAPCPEWCISVIVISILVIIGIICGCLYYFKPWKGGKPSEAIS